MTITQIDERDAFSAVFRATAGRVRAYTARHVGPDDIDEIVAETYATAWRRRDRLDPGDPVPWLLVTARNHIANLRRSRGRREQTAPDLEQVAAVTPSVEEPVLDRRAALSALAGLSDLEREAVLLVAWDGLDPRAAAQVVGCSVRAFTVRLHRARSRLTRLLDQADTPETDRVRSVRPRPTVVEELS